MNKKMLGIIITVILIMIIAMILGINVSLKIEKNNIDQKENLKSNTDEISKKVTMEILEDTITKESVMVLITNHSEEKCGWGVEYKVQRKINNKWEDLEPINNAISIPMIAYQMKGKQSKIKIDYGKEYGTLEKGTYRIVKLVQCKGYIELCSNEFTME